MQVNVKRIHPDAKLPTYATDGSGCFDLYAHRLEGGYGHLRVFDGVPLVCSTGLAFEVPDGHVMLVFSRSGHGFNYSVRLANCVGVIDSDYRGEVKVKLTCDENNERDDLLVSRGDRIAQALILPVERVEFVDVPVLSDTGRGTGEFGSSGA
ncbi:MAG: dUTP diphosphatase [Dechloromonas sp.]|nr:dUTP diphosphatase [Dechloromonas sp.]